MKKLICGILAITSILLPCSSCNLNQVDSSSIYFGYSEKELVVTEDMSPIYMGGYKSGLEPEGVLDYQEVKATYLNYYGGELLMISIDCIGLSSHYVEIIRQGIGVNFPINVISTHTHAGVDTLGLWGPIGLDGKNDDFMNMLLSYSIKAGKEAINNQKVGQLTYGLIKTENVLEDTRSPYIYDENMYQLRFIPADGSAATRMIFYGAHAEALRGKNKLISADFPGYMSKVIKEKTGDNMIYFNGAIGGLVITKDFDSIDVINNMRITGKTLAEYALNIQESTLEVGNLQQKRISFDVELDNVLFKYYGFLGILKADIYKNIYNNKYYMRTETSIIKLGDLTFLLIPGEIFPELIFGGARENPESGLNNPTTILDLTKIYGVEKLITIGLCNDEIGYIVPPSDFLLNEEYPYIQNRTDDTGENHYEETNSTGVDTSFSLYNALKKCFEQF